MESRLEKIFSMGINIMSLAVWLGEDRKCSAAVVGLDLLLGLSMVRRCSLRRLTIVFRFSSTLTFDGFKKAK